MDRNATIRFDIAPPIFYTEALRNVINHILDPVMPRRTTACGPMPSRTSVQAARWHTHIENYSAEK